MDIVTLADKHHKTIPDYKKLLEGLNSFITKITGKISTYYPARDEDFGAWYISGDQSGDPFYKIVITVDGLNCGDDNLYYWNQMDKFIKDFELNSYRYK